MLSRMAAGPHPDRRSRLSKCKARSPEEPERLPKEMGLKNHWFACPVKAVDGSISRFMHVDGALAAHSEMHDRSVRSCLLAIELDIRAA